ncbi:MAG: hypothetical protein II875_04180 [Clostridia bacterium]|nr:hypothetical protein [Clostridia bacterium]
MGRRAVALSIVFVILLSSMAMYTLSANASEVISLYPSYYALLSTNSVFEDLNSIDFYDRGTIKHFCTLLMSDLACCLWQAYDIPALDIFLYDAVLSKDTNSASYRLFCRSSNNLYLLLFEADKKDTKQLFYKSDFIDSSYIDEYFDNYAYSKTVVPDGFDYYTVSSDYYGQVVTVSPTDGLTINLSGGASWTWHIPTTSQVSSPSPSSTPTPTPRPTQKPSTPFTNKYGTPTTKCAHYGCTNYIASSGDTAYCTTHSQKCVSCRKYIDEDATYCMDCIYKALYGN